MRLPQSWRCAAIALCVTATIAIAADWPQYQCDSARSSVSRESLEFPLWKTWSHQPLQSPRPAWPEPGRELHRIDFDYTFHPVVAEGRVYFGSSADDTVYVLDAQTGVEIWHYVTGGPIRFAPSVWRGRVFVASDDGHVYSLNTKSGALDWRVRIAPAADRLIGNGRMISRWPLRTGLVVDDGILYTTAGMWPGEGIYVCALKADTGQVVWRNASSGDTYMDLPHPGASAFTGVAPQGYLALSGDMLLVPTGRSVPAGFDRRTGQLKFYRPALYRSDGGVWTATGGGYFFNAAHGGGPDIDVELGESDPRSGDGLKAYSTEDGKQAFVLSEKHRVAVAGGVLYASGGGKVEAYDLHGIRGGGQLQEYVKWSAAHGRAYCLARAENALFVGGRGTITAFNTDDGSVLWRDEVRGQVRALVVSDGRLLAATDEGRLVCYENYPVRVPSRDIVQKPQWQDAPPGTVGSIATRILDGTGVREGSAVVLDRNDARLAVALALQSDLHVIALLPDEEHARAAREMLLPTGYYGQRVAVHSLSEFEAGRLPFAPYCTDLLVINEDPCGVASDALHPLARTIHERFADMLSVGACCVERGRVGRMLVSWVAKGSVGAFPAVVF